MAHYVTFPVAANPAQPAAAYQAQTAYVATAPPTPYAATPRAGQYDGYQTAHPTPQYAYTTRPQVAVTPVSYDQTKAYYQPTQAAAYTAAETPQHYQQGFESAYQMLTPMLIPAIGVLPAAAKPAYTSSSTYTTQRQTPKAPAVQVTTTGATYVYTATSTPAVPVTTYQPTYATNTTQASFSGYDAALYTAATSYYQQQTVKPAAGTWAMKKPGSQFKPKPKGPPKQPQLHYCDVCKISCAGPQTYREHLEGQKHKKKEQAQKGGGNQPGGRGHNQLRCELCDVTCTGSDAYTAHIRGAKHQKVVKLHTKLGKPIPSSEPVVFNTATSTATKVTTAATAAAATPSQAAKAPAVARPTIAATTQPGAKKIMATPKITFVGGTQLKTTGTKTEEVKVETMKADISPSSSEAKLSDSEEKLNILGEKDVNPVGHEYIDEVKNEQGKTISFNCKLCECKFNDPNAKEMHLKGRRHRLQYKKKVDPNLQVEVKPSIRARKVQEERLRRQAQKEEFFRRKEQEDRWREEMRMEDEMYWDQHRHHRYEMMEYFEWQRHPAGPGMMPPRPFPPQMGPGGPMLRKPETSDDRHVMAKHNSIYPTEAELQAVQNIVSSCERALKQVSDYLAETDGPKKDSTEAKKDSKDTDSKDGEKKEEGGGGSSRVLKGVMRVGVLAKGLLLHGDLNVHLVVLCSEKPTRTMLERVADCLPKQLATVTEEKYELKRCVEEAAIIVSSDKEPQTTCTITLTSPVMREANLPDGETVSVKDPPDVLDRVKCLDALAALRHAKWFQARANGLQSCVVVIRILRDLCNRVTTWKPLNEWAMELLVEKCVSSGGPNMSPGDALRRIFECIASGILLPGGPGLLDPCEKETVDAAGTLLNQQREDITASAQHALRLIAFRQIHKVLGMDALAANRFQRRNFNPRKRRRTNSAGDGTDSEVIGEKKDKKDEDAPSAMDTSTDGAQA